MLHQTLHRAALALVAAAVFPFGAPSAAADVVRLPNGGVVRGTITSGPGDATIEIRSLLGTIYQFDREEVVGLSRRAIEREIYAVRARRLETNPSSQGHRELADWCREQRLGDQRREQLQHVLAFDPDDEAIRRELRHKWVDGRWQTPQERNRTAGLVEDGGDWVPPRVAEARAAAKRREISERKWFVHLRTLRARVDGWDPAARLAALNEVSRIHDAAAIRPLQQLFAIHPWPNVRLAAIDSLEQIGGASSIPPLVALAVLDIDETVRAAAFAVLDPAVPADSVRELTGYLSSPHNVHVVRAAGHLETLGEVTATPLLIRALNTKHRELVQPVQAQPLQPMNLSGIDPAMVNQLMDMGMLPPLYEPPKQIPMGRARHITRTYQNEAVLKALRTLTEQDFGYDEGRWFRWWKTAQRKLVPPE